MDPVGRSRVWFVAQRVLRGFNRTTSPPFLLTLRTLHSLAGITLSVLLALTSAFGLRQAIVQINPQQAGDGGSVEKPGVDLWLLSFGLLLASALMMLGSMRR